MAGTGVFRIDGPAAGETFILTVVETNAVLSQSPAQVHIFVLDHGRKIDESRIEVFYDASGRLNLLERVLHLLYDLIQVGAQAGRRVVINRNAAHDLNAVGDGAQTFFKVAHFAAPLHRIDQQRLDLTARVFGFRETEYFLLVLFWVHE